LALFMSALLDNAIPLSSIVWLVCIKPRRQLSYILYSEFPRHCLIMNISYSQYEPCSYRQFGRFFCSSFHNDGVATLDSLYLINESSQRLFPNELVVYTVLMIVLDHCVGVSAILQNDYSFCGLNNHLDVH
jgi:hypothetical protein